MLCSQDYKYTEKTYTDTSKDKEIYWKKDGDLTELSSTDVKINKATVYKLGDSYFVCYEYFSMPRISGSGLYSTFELTYSDGSAKCTFKEDGTLLIEYSYKDSEGKTQSRSESYTYTSNNGLISLYSEGTNVRELYYDGQAVYAANIFEEVSGLPTVTETTD